MKPMTRESDDTLSAWCRSILLWGVDWCGLDQIFREEAVAKSHASHETKERTVEFTQFVRKPFEIEALEITVDNIDEIAPMVGKLGRTDEGVPYIEVDHDLVPNMTRVWPGYWLTRMGGNIRCYASRVFADQFVAKPHVSKNCDTYAKCDFGHGPVEIRCTETGEHKDHWCDVRIFEDGSTKAGQYGT